MPEVTEEEYQEYLSFKKAKKEEEALWLERFRVKSHCDSCGRQSIDIYPENSCPDWQCNGVMR